MKRQIIVVSLLILLSAWMLGGEINFSGIKNRVTEFTLDNGLTFIVLEDHSVPIANFITYANVGSSDERIGIYGISHYLEHMAFKGTGEIGTADIKKERAIFAKMDRVFEEIKRERSGRKPDPEKLKELEAHLQSLSDEAREYVVPNEFSKILKRHGCVGMNAGTGADFTLYFYSLPSNKLELWAAMESQRFIDPVFREFYRERQVIAEERRVRTENSPVGKMIEELCALAFKDHSYHVSVIGPMSNIQNITRQDMKKYFRRNYSARNLVIGVAGDVYPQRVKKMAKKYFAGMSPGRKNHRLYTTEPPQAGEKRMTIFENSQPWLAMGYHIPSELHQDFIKFSVLDNILTRGRSSRMNKKLVIDEKSALAVISMAGFPGSKYSCLYMVLALPNSGHTTEEMERAFLEEFDQIRKEGITEEELSSAKTRLKFQIIQGLNSRQGVLRALLHSEVIHGSWERAFDQLTELEAVTAEDIQNLLKTYFDPSNRVIVKIEKKEVDK